MITITHINELREKVAHKEEIREAQHPWLDFTVFCYMIAENNTFDDAWARECRGIVFGLNGRVAARPLHKFFNVNEREETQQHVLPWDKVRCIMDKRDGSMIHTVINQDNGVVSLKSKKSFESDVAKAASAWAAKHEGLQRMFYDLARQDLTAIFEWTAPDARIVLYYPEAELRLLHIRENVNGTYKPRELTKLWAATYGIKPVDEVKEFFDADGKIVPSALLDAAQTREGVEGWVIQFEGGEMVKLKTKWYLERHRAMTFLRERDIAEMVLHESIDDLKSLLATEGVDLAPILEIEHRVVADLNELRKTVDEMVPEEDYKMERKDFAIKYKGMDVGPFFGLLMTRYLGKEINFTEFFEKYYLKDRYTLRQLNLVPSVAEAE